MTSTPILPDPKGLDPLLAKHKALVDRKLSELDAVPLGAERRLLIFGGMLSDGTLYTPEQNRLALARGFAEMIEVMGELFVSETDAVILEQYQIMALHSQRHAPRMLKELLNSYMGAFMVPHTHELAFEALKTLARLNLKATPTPGTMNLTMQLQGVSSTVKSNVEPLNHSGIVITGKFPKKD